MSVIKCKLEQVESSNLAAMGYDRDRQTLVIVFRGGATWAYEAVEPDRWRGMMMAPSKGKYLRTHVQALRKGRKIDPITIVQPEEE